MTLMQQALDALKALPTKTRAIDIAIRDIEVALVTASEPVLFIDAQTLAMDNAHVGAWKPGHELPGNLPLYLHPAQPVVVNEPKQYEPLPEVDSSLPDNDLGGMVGAIMWVGIFIAAAMWVLK